jgi:aldehyde dehydrogenase (NAD+)
VTQRHQHWIDGKAEPPASGRYPETTDPSTGQPGDEVAAGAAADVECAVGAARVAQPAWRRMATGERSDVLHRIADEIGREADELIALERAGTGKVPAQARLEVEMSAVYFRYYAGVDRAVGGRTIDLGARAHASTRLENVSPR